MESINEKLREQKEIIKICVFFFFIWEEDEEKTLEKILNMIFQN